MEVSEDTAEAKAARKAQREEKRRLKRLKKEQKALEAAGGKKPRKRERSTFDDVLDQVKKKRRKNAPIGEEEAQRRVQEVIDAMREAKLADDEAKSQGQPRTHKVAMLERVCTEVSKPRWQAWFLHEGLCQVLADWLEVQEDKSLPSLHMRSRLISVIQKLPLNADILQGTTLGHALVDLYFHPEETEANKKVLRDIVNHIVRPLLGLSWSYRAGVQMTGTEQPMETKEERGGLLAQMATQKTDEDGRSKFARVPRVAGHAFTVMPTSQSESNRTRKPTRPLPRRG